METKEVNTQSKAGRPKGRGPYRETTQPVRIPKTLLNDIQSVLSEYKHAKAANKDFGRNMWLPKLRNHSVEALTSEDNATLDLNEHLLENPANKFFVKASDNSMVTAKISEGDILIAERYETIPENKIVIANVNGKTIIRYVSSELDSYILYTDNANSTEAIKKPKKDVNILGVVTNIIQKV